MSLGLQKQVAWEGSIPGTLYKQIFVHPKPLPSDLRLNGRTAIITGASGGLGFEAARHLLKLKLSYLIIAVRSQAKGDAASTKLREEFPTAQIDVWIIDLADYASIVAFADRCRKLEEAIHYVILNAGLQNSKFEKNEKTGHESVMQTNYLSTALQLLLLVPVLTEKKNKYKLDQPPVMTAVGSDTMYFSSLKQTESILDLMDNPTRFVKFQQYMDSKLLLMMFAARLAETVSADDVIINVCNPGMTGGTNLGREEGEEPGFAARYIVPIFIKALARSGSAGASNYVHALLMEGKLSHGSFVSDWAIKP